MFSVPFNIQGVAPGEIIHKSEDNKRNILIILLSLDRLCGLVVRVSGYRSRGPGFNSRLYQIF
jgi:hypothetical protein